MKDLGNLLITGGTGTFGHAFIETVQARNLAKRITVLSRDEKKQQDLMQLYPDVRCLIGDVRDRDRLERAFSGVDTIVHAAALKQVQRSGEEFDEFLKTNALGALNVAGAAHRAGVKRVVALSTDKAVEASTPYGVSKAAMEWVIVGANAWGPCRFSLVRYGNILGSRGSVLELWRQQMLSEGRILITEENMTRFWLPIQDAVELVLIALDRMGGGEIFIPKGVPRSSVWALAGKHFPRVYRHKTGKRSYEKMHEALIATEEADRVRDCGDVYVVQPLHVRWQPRPYGEDCPAVSAGFEYRSNTKGK